MDKHSFPASVVTPELGDRVDWWLHTLKQDFYHPLNEMRFEGFTTFDRLSPAEALRGPFKPFPAGTAWGEEWEYAWLKTRVVLPPEAEGKRIVMDLKPEGESTLFVNGVSMGTYRASWVNEPHHFVEDNALCRCGRAGEAYDVLIEVYAGHFFPGEHTGCAVGPVLGGELAHPDPHRKRRTLGACTFGVWNEAAYQLYMDAETLCRTLCVVPSSSLRAAKLAEALAQFTYLVDFEQPARDREADYAAAREALAPLLTAKNGSTAPLFSAVGNAHIDLAWLWPMAETLRKTSRTFAAQLRLLDEYPDYVFLQSQPALYRMCETYDPQLFDRIKEAAKGGRWIPEGAMYVEPDTNMPSGEALVRQLLYGKRYFQEQFGVDSRMLWLPDSFGYSAALPQLLKSAGVDYLVTQKIFWSYNGGEQFPYHYFTWRGMDGSEVATFLPTSYTYRTDPSQLAEVWEKRVQKTGLDGFLLPFGYGDGGGGPCRDDLEYARREKDLEGVPRVRMENPVDFFRRLEDEGGPEHTYSGELYFTAHRGVFTSQAEVKRLNRRCEFALREAELWGALAAVRAGAAYPENELQDMWQTLLLHQFHDILPGSSIARVYDEAEEALGTLLARGNTAAGEARGALVSGGEGVTVFNSLCWERSALVRLDERFADGGTDALGRPVPVGRLGDAYLGMVRVPACGMIGVTPAETPAAFHARAALTEQGATLENDRLAVRLNAEGEIVSCVLKETGRQFAGGRMNRLRLFKDVPRIFDAWDIDANYLEQEIPLSTPARLSVACAQGPIAAITVEREVGHSALRQTISLAEGADRVEFDTTVRWNELHRLLSVSFQTEVRTTEAIHEIQFGYLKRPAHRSRVYDQDRFEVCNHRYTALCDSSHGAAVLNDGKYGVSAQDGEIRLTLLRAPGAPAFRADNRTHRFRYALLPWEGGFAQSPVVREGYELNVPLETAEGTADAASFFTLAEPGVILDTVKMAEDGSGDLIVRLYEAAGADCACTLKAAFPLAEVTETNLLEAETGRVEAQSGAIRLHFTPFQVRTLRLKRA